MFGNVEPSRFIIRRLVDLGCLGDIAQEDSQLLVVEEETASVFTRRNLN